MNHQQATHGFNGDMNIDRGNLHRPSFFGVGRLVSPYFHAIVRIELLISDGEFVYIYIYIHIHIYVYIVIRLMTESKQVHRLS